MFYTELRSILVSQLIRIYTVFKIGYTVKPVLRGCSKQRPKNVFQDGLLLNAGQKYSRTSMARTRRDRRCEFDPSMCSSDTWPDNFQVGSCVLYVITDTTFFIDQSCKAHVTPVTPDQ